MCPSRLGWNDGDHASDHMRRSVHYLRSASLAAEESNESEYVALLTVRNQLSQAIYEVEVVEALLGAPACGPLSHVAGEPSMTRGASI